MPTKQIVQRGTGRRPDPDGEAWQAEAARRWDQAVDDGDTTGDAAIALFTPPPLPAWTSPAHVTRDLLGRYLLDRHANVLHDTAHALESCELDAIANATFVHFASELADALPADVADCACMRA